MKKAFTLVELLVVTVVIAILASVSFRMVSSSEASEARQITITRMQRIENCLSGYYAAFGSYPPVAISKNVSSNPFYELNGKGNQKLDKDPDYGTLDWSRVEPACRAQPIAVEFPFNGSADPDSAAGDGSYPKKLSDAIQVLMQDSAFAEQYGQCPAATPFDAGNVNAIIAASRSHGFEPFTFGLMSYLIPRALTMMTAERRLFTECPQWQDNNSLPCRFSNGVPYEGWGQLNDIVLGKTGDVSEKLALELIPSQAVCRRWIANLEGICSDCMDVVAFGVVLSSGGQPYNPQTPSDIPIKFVGDPLDDAKSSGMLPNRITLRDGFPNAMSRGREFYYYSPPPFQSYRLWSAGPNGKTFPPWMTDDQLQTDNNLKQHINTINEWIADDIVHMSN